MRCPTDEVTGRRAPGWRCPRRLPAGCPSPRARARRRGTGRPEYPDRCRSEPQIAVGVTLMTASLGSLELRSATSVTGTSRLPCQVSALISHSVRCDVRRGRQRAGPPHVVLCSRSGQKGRCPPGRAGISTFGAAANLSGFLAGRRGSGARSSPGRRRQLDEDNGSRRYPWRRPAVVSPSRQPIDRDGRSAGQSQQLSYDAANRQITSVDPLEIHRRVYTIRRVDRLRRSTRWGIAVAHPTTRRIARSPASIRSGTYQRRHTIRRVDRSPRSIPWGSDQLRLRCRRSAVSTTNALGFASTTVYDASNRQIASVDALGNI